MTDEVYQVTIHGKTLDEVNAECRKQCVGYMNFGERACANACPRLLRATRPSAPKVNKK